MGFTKYSGRRAQRNVPVMPYCVSSDARGSRSSSELICAAAMSTAIEFNFLWR